METKKAQPRFTDEFKIEAVKQVTERGRAVAGDYAWKQQPVSERSAEDQRVGALITQCREASGRVYGYRKIRNDLHGMGEPCGKHRGRG